MTQVSLYFFSFLEQIWNYVSVTFKMVKIVMTKLDSSKASGPDCTPVVVLKIYDPELSDISWTLQYVPEEVLFSRLLEDLSGGSCI